MRKNNKFSFGWSLAFCVFSIFIASFLTAQPEKLLYVKAKRIYTCDENRVIDNGGILIKGKKILKVEKKIKPPKDAEIIDFTDFIVIPGLIDAHSSVGFHEEDFKVQTEPKPWSPFYPSGFRITPPGTTAPTPKAEARFQAAQRGWTGKRFQRPIEQVQESMNLDRVYLHGPYNVPIT